MAKTWVDYLPLQAEQRETDQGRADRLRANRLARRNMGSTDLSLYSPQILHIIQ